LGYGCIGCQGFLSIMTKHGPCFNKHKYMWGIYSQPIFELGLDIYEYGGNIGMALCISFIDRTIKTTSPCTPTLPRQVSVPCS